MAIFQVVPTSVKPTLSWSNFSLSLPGFWKEIVAAGVMIFLGEKMRFEVPLTHTPVLSLGDPPADDRPELKFRKMRMPIKETGGFVDLEVVHVNSDLTLALNFATPLFSPDGVWLLATDKAFVPPSEPLPASLSDASVDSLRKQVAQLHAAAPAPDGDVAVFLNHRALVSLINRARSLSNKERSVYAKSTDYRGKLFQVKWRDNNLGEGGIFVEPRKKDFAEIAAVINPPEVQWVPREGVRLKTSVNASATGGGKGVRSALSS